MVLYLVCMNTWMYTHVLRYTILGIVASSRFTVHQKKSLALSCSKIEPIAGFSQV